LTKRACYGGRSQPKIKRPSSERRKVRKEGVIKKKGEREREGLVLRVKKRLRSKNKSRSTNRKNDASNFSKPKRNQAKRIEKKGSK